MLSHQIIAAGPVPSCVDTDAAYLTRIRNQRLVCCFVSFQLLFQGAFHHKL